MLDCAVRMQMKVSTRHFRALIKPMKRYLVEYSWNSRGVGRRDQPQVHRGRCAHARDVVRVDSLAGKKLLTQVSSSSACRSCSEVVFLKSSHSRFCPFTYDCVQGKRVAYCCGPIPNFKEKFYPEDNSIGGGEESAGEPLSTGGGASTGGGPSTGGGEPTGVPPTGGGASTGGGVSMGAGSSTYRVQPSSDQVPPSKQKREQHSSSSSSQSDEEQPAADQQSSGYRTGMHIYRLTI